MKKDIHPQVYTNATVTCACGNSFSTISTKKDIKVEICSMCHPFFTGQQRFVDTEGRIERFEKKVKEAQKRKPTKKVRRKTKDTEIKQLPSLKDLLSKARKTK